MKSELINDTINMYFDNIPNFNNNVKLPIITTYINDVPLITLIDSGSVKSIITSNAVIKSELGCFVDKNTISTNYGIGTIQSIGKIWYTSLKINNNLSLPTTFDVITKIFSDIDIILGNDFIDSYCDLINFKKKYVSIMDNIIYY